MLRPAEGEQRRTRKRRGSNNNCCQTHLLHGFSPLPACPILKTMPLLVARHCDRSKASRTSRHGKLERCFHALATGGVIWPPAAIGSGSLASPQSPTASNRRQFESISTSKSFRPHTCGRLGESGAWWFLPRTLR